MTTIDKNSSEAQAAIEVMRELHQPQFLALAGDLEVDEPALMAIPKGMSLVDLKPYQDARRERPERIQGTARLTTLDSFIEHVKRFADPESALFAIDDPKAPKLLAVFDYHESHDRPKGEGEHPASVENRGDARFGAHRAEYAFPLSDEFVAWRSVADKALTQAQFAEFLEDRLVDVVAPEEAFTSIRDLAAQLGIELAGPSVLLTLSKGLAIRVDQKVANVINLSTGEAQLHFEETHATKDGGSLKVPNGFAVAIPVFRGGVRYQIGIRLRYRVHNGAITWRLLPQRIEVVFADAVGEAAVEARMLTGLPLFFGTPES